jgi:hypothetical protein
MKEKEELHHVFWTGGLDSTFRVLNLLFTTNELVQPHYIVRHEESTGNEIDAMNNIRRAVLRDYPELHVRFQPTIYTNEDLIPIMDDVVAAIEEIRKTVNILEQYEIIARYCRAFQIKKIDLTYEMFMDKNANAINAGTFFGTTFPFEPIANPHKDMYKKDYYTIARKDGWDKYLDMTSFCRRPVKKTKPCGTCGPCYETMTSGLGFRLPLKARIKYRILKPFRAFYRKNYLKHDHVWIFRVMKRRFEHKF